MFFHFSLPKLGSGPPVASGVTVQMLISAPERWRHQTDLISNTFVAKPWFRYVSRFRTNSKLPDCGFKNKVAGHVTNYAQPSWKISHLFGEEAHLWFDATIKIKPIYSSFQIQKDYYFFLSSCCHGNQIHPIVTFPECVEGLHGDVRHLCQIRLQFISAVRHTAGWQMTALLSERKSNELDTHVYKHDLHPTYSITTFLSFTLRWYGLWGKYHLFCAFPELDK